MPSRDAARGGSRHVPDGRPGSRSKPSSRGDDAVVLPSRQEDGVAQSLDGDFRIGRRSYRNARVKVLLIDYCDWYGAQRRSKVSASIVRRFLVRTVGISGSRRGRRHRPRRRRRRLQHRPVMPCRGRASSGCFVQAVRHRSAYDEPGGDTFPGEQERRKLERGGRLKVRQPLRRRRPFDDIVDLA